MESKTDGVFAVLLTEKESDALIKIMNIAMKAVGMEVPGVAATILFITDKLQQAFKQAKELPAPDKDSPNTPSNVVKLPEPVK